MKLLLLFLVLIGTTFIDVTQARTIEKREVNEDEDINIGSYNSICTCQDGICNRCDDNGCNTVSNCNGKREASDIDYAGAAELVKMFKANNEMSCKCLNHGYCLKQNSKKEYTEVKGCGESKCYIHCDSSGCREVCDGQCECDINRGAAIRCEKCDDKGCQQVAMCKSAFGSSFAGPDKCQDCGDQGCVPYKVPESSLACPRSCNDELDDIPIEDKCTCKKDENGNEKCQMCGKYSCNPVPDCSTFATCKCTLNSREDSYRRCYGFNHGQHHCREMFSCTEFKKRDEEWRRVRGDGKQGVASSCEKMSNGLIKQCGTYGFCYYDKTCDISYAYTVTAHLH